MLDPSNYNFKEFERSVYAAQRAVTFDEFMTYQNARDDQESDEVYKLRHENDGLQERVDKFGQTEEELNDEINDLKSQVSSLEIELTNLENGHGRPEID